MTTVVVVRKDKQIAIAADTLTTCSGDIRGTSKYIVNSSKLFKLGDTYFASSGSASWDLVLTSYYKSLSKKPDLTSTQAIFEFIRAMHPALKEGYYLHSEADNDDDFEPSNTAVLMANKKGIFSIDGYRSVLEHSRFYAYGSGKKFALGAMFALYDKKLSAREIAKVGVTAGCELDEWSEGPIEVKTIALD